MTDALPPLTDDDLMRIEAAARAARPGKRLAWYYQGEWFGRGKSILSESGCRILCDGRTIAMTSEASEEGATEAPFIATADPQTVLRLVEEVRRLRVALEGTA